MRRHKRAGVRTQPSELPTRRSLLRTRGQEWVACEYMARMSSTRLAACCAALLCERA
jgi:hypothetical protein